MKLLFRLFVMLTIIGCNSNTGLDIFACDKENSIENCKKNCILHDAKFAFKTDKADKKAAKNDSFF